MRAWEISGGFGLDKLRWVQRPHVAPGPGQVGLRVLAASLNFRDLLMVRGLYNPRQPLPLVPGSDAVCEVTALGEGVTGLSIGQRVCPTFFQGWWGGEPDLQSIRPALGGPLDGVLRQQLVVSAQGVVPAPEHLDDAQAATLPCAALTAWSALVTQGGVTAGDTVLVLGTGGVSIFALQLSKLLGARVIVTSSSDAKLERARALGADDCINYRSHPKWSREVRRLTDNRGVDLVVEVGGAGTLQQSLRSVRVGGQVSLIGVLAGAAGPVPLTSILMQNIRVQGVLVGSREGFLAMNRAITAHQLQPVVDRVFELQQLPEALEFMAAGKHFGKLALRA